MNQNFEQADPLAEALFNNQPLLETPKTSKPKKVKHVFDNDNEQEINNMAEELMAEGEQFERKLCEKKPRRLFKTPQRKMQFKNFTNNVQSSNSSRRSTVKVKNFSLF